VKIKSQAEEGNSTHKSFLSYHISPKGDIMDTEQPCLHEPVSILHELDLGRHTLIMMSDGSIELLANDAQTPSPADKGLSLDSDEMYRLFISLQEQLKYRTLVI
jgi:hypothetical protein